MVISELLYCERKKHILWIENFELSIATTEIVEVHQVFLFHILNINSFYIDKRSNIIYIFIDRIKNRSYQKFVPFRMFWKNVIS